MLQQDFNVKGLTIADYTGMSDLSSTDTNKALHAVINKLTDNSVQVVPIILVFPIHPFLEISPETRTGV